MNWKKFWDTKAQNSVGLSQVARIKSGTTLSEELMNRIAEKIIQQLEIKPADEILDVCCGNGVLTTILAKYCKSIDAIDLSAKQIQQAKNSNTLSTVAYFEGNAMNFNLDKKYDKILLYFSFQYFDQKGDGQKVIQNLLNHSKTNSIILVGDIPDSARKIYYFKNYLQLLKYTFKNLLHKSDMGKFWSKKEMDSICKFLNLKGLFLKQESWQPYAHYRFDYIIKS